MPTNTGETQPPSIERIDVQIDTLRAYRDEEDFTALSVDLLRETASHVCVAACLLPGDTKAWSRNQAVLGGLLVRLFKMLSAVLDQTCQHRRETTFIFLRLSFECIVNVRYLISLGSDDMYEAYVAYSLRHERRLFERIQENIKARRGEKLPIEERMLDSIGRSFRKSGISLEGVTSSTFGPWKKNTLLERAQAVDLGEAYLGLVGGPSHTVHGNWQDLLEYHLDETESGFVPELEWHRPRPQPLFVISILTLQMLEDYVVQLVGEHAKPLLDDLDDLRERLDLANDEHEHFLSKGRDE